MLARPTRRATYHSALGSGELIPQNERELRCSEGSGMLIGDPLGSRFKGWFKVLYYLSHTQSYRV